jgi:hypothetical protein
MLARTRTLWLAAMVCSPAALGAQKSGQPSAPPPQVQPQLAEFQQVLRARMVQIDPTVQPLLDRLQEIEQQLEQTAGAGV